VLHVGGDRLAQHLSAHLFTSKSGTDVRRHPVALACYQASPAFHGIFCMPRLEPRSTHGKRTSCAGNTWCTYCMRAACQANWQLLRVTKGLSLRFTVLRRSALRSGHDWLAVEWMQRSLMLVGGQLEPDHDHVDHVEFCRLGNLGRPIEAPLSLISSSGVIW